MASTKTKQSNHNTKKMKKTQDYQDCETCYYLKKDCICDDSWKYLDKHMNEYNDYLNKYNEKLIQNRLEIFTITFDFKLSHVSLDFNKIIEQFDSNPKKGIFIKDYKNNYGGKKSKNKEINNKMYNTMFCTAYFNKIKISIKMFHNGSIVILGCKNILQCMYSIHHLLDFLKSFKQSVFINHRIIEYRGVKNLDIQLIKGKKKLNYKDIPLARIDVDMRKKVIKRIQIIRNIEFENKDSEFIHDIKHFKAEHILVKKELIQNEERVEPLNLKISMINSKFKINQRINQRLFNDILSDSKLSIHNCGPIISTKFGDKNNIAINFLPGKDKKLDISKLVETRKRHVKIPRQLSIQVHGTGSIILNGSKNLYDILEAYRFLLSTFYKHKDNILINK